MNVLFWEQLRDVLVNRKVQGFIFAWHARAGLVVLLLLLYPLALESVRGSGSVYPSEKVEDEVLGVL